MAIGQGLPHGREEIDARGLQVLPGGVDVHTHLDLDLGGVRTADDFEAGTAAAACGGVTTICDYAWQAKGQSLAATIDTWKAKAAGRAHGFALQVTEYPWGCDYFVEHGRMMPENGRDMIRKHDAILFGAVGALPSVLAPLATLQMWSGRYGAAVVDATEGLRLAEETGGEMLDPNKMEEGIKRLYTPTPGKATRGQETWWPLSGLGLFLFLADLVLRSWPRKSTAL